jgi:hypothetical protein
MNLDRFQDLLDSHGCAIGNWPVHEQEAARRLVAADKEAAARLAGAAKLDRLIEGSLGSRMFGSGSGEEASRVLARLPGKLPPQQPARIALADRLNKALNWLQGVRDTGLPWPQAAALAFAAALGVVAGLYGAELQTLHERQILVAQQESEPDLTAVLSRDTEVLR